MTPEEFEAYKGGYRSWIGLWNAICDHHDGTDSLKTCNAWALGALHGLSDFAGDECSVVRTVCLT